ncbi:agmatinase [Spongiivirga citrea]|uniref:Agmatinase n=1 Tax=Spongiivirga citrea TaxID=1481457 RepID=A0A6M0CFS5_9FLAO|nr:agmatinase [Spongiivirga citrea]NER16736.1 agmatinase [Spongiivirga citrea]
MIKKIGLQGILYDDKSSFAQGPAQAPPLIREAYNSHSANYFAEEDVEIRPELFDDKGDFTINEYFDIETITATNLEKGTPLITLGGDHSITYPIIKSFYQKYGQLNILHIDAHGDLYHEFEGDKYSHACPFARIMEDGLAKKLVQVGIRTYNTHQREQAKKYGVTSIEMKDFALEKILPLDGPLYVSVDIDALDPAFAPGISHYEPGGLTTRELLSIIQQINTPIIGADIVEYNPTRDYNKMTAMICAKILKELAVKCI